MKERLREFAYLSRSEAYRRKGQHGDGRSTEQRPLRIPYDVACGFFLVHSSGDGYQIAVGNHDRVVHQHAERQDERAERDFLKVDIQKVHADESGQNIEYQNESYKESAPPAHKKHEQSYDYPNRFDQVDKERIHGIGDYVTLVVDRVHFHAQRFHRLEFVDPPAHCLAHLHDVASVHRGYAYPDGRAPVEPHNVRRGFRETARDGRHIP